MRIIFVLALLLFPRFGFAEDIDIKKRVSLKSASVPVPPSKLDFQFVSVSQVLNLLFSEALPIHFVLDPDVLEDKRLVSFRYEAAKGDLKTFVFNFLDSLGFVAVTKSGVVYVSKKPILQDVELAGFEKDILFYVPKYRDAGYLSRLLSPLFKGSFTASRALPVPLGTASDKKVPEGSAAASVEQNTDVLIFSGSEKEVKVLSDLLAKLDIRQGEVMLKAVLYEVTSSEADGSAVSLVSNLLGGKFGFSLSAAKVSENFVKFKNNTLDLMISALATDARFKVLSTPSLRVRSGALGSFTVGQDVPVLGAVNYQQNGVPVQSIVYKSSGVIFNVTPTVHDVITDIDIDQQVSNFVLTETGVNNSPTLIKRELKTHLSLVDGDVVVMGGLDENKTSASGSRLSFFPAWTRSAKSNESKSEIVLMLQLNKL